MEREREGKRRPLGSEALGILLGRWRDGTFADILTDWKWILTYTRRYRRAVWAYTVLGVISSTLGLVSAVASKYTIDIITGYDSSQLWFVILVMLLSALIGLLLRSVTSRISTRIALWVNNDIQAEVFDRLLNADWQALNGFPGGDLLNRLTNDTGSVASNAIHWLPDLIVAAYSFIATLAVILHYDWIMALLALASAPFLLLTSRRLIGGMRSHQQHLRQVSSDLMAYETETLHNLDAIKGFGIAGLYSSGLRQRQPRLRQSQLQRRIQTPVCLDESIFSAKDLAKALKHQELKCYALKIGKFGGIQPALQFVRMANARGMSVWMGGMYDTGISRRMHAAFQMVPGVVDAGDIGATSRYFDVDVTDPPYTVERGVVTLERRGHEHGLGCTLDRPALSRVLIDQQTYE